MASTSESNVQLQKSVAERLIHNCKCKYSLGAYDVQSMQFEIQKILDSKFSNHIFEFNLNRFNVFWHQKLIKDMQEHPKKYKINTKYKWDFGSNTNDNNNAVHHHYHYHNTYNVDNIEQQHIHGPQHVHNQTIQKQLVEIQHVKTQINAIEHISLVSRRVNGKYKIKCLEAACLRRWPFLVTTSNGYLKKRALIDHNDLLKHGGRFRFLCLFEDDNGNDDDDNKCGQELLYPQDLRDRRVTHINGEPISKYTDIVRLTCCKLLIHLHSHEVSQKTDEETDDETDDEESES
eukprot:270249_1